MKTVPKLIYMLNRLRWKITRPVTVGVRVMMIRDGKALLVRHTYQDHWYLPGGGMKKGETFEQAIRREASEEVGAALQSLRLFGIYNNFYEGKNDTVVIFVSEAFDISGETDSEIERFGFFDMNAPPDKTSPGTKKRLEEYKDGNAPYCGVW